MFGTLLTITWPPNNTGLPPDSNPAYNPSHDLMSNKVNEMQAAALLGNITIEGYVNNFEFVNSASALEYQNFVTEIMVDFNLTVPEFVITDIN